MCKPCRSRLSTHRACRDRAPLGGYFERTKGSRRINGRAWGYASHDILSVPPPELPKTHSVLTIGAGKVVHDSGGTHSR